MVTLMQFSSLQISNYTEKKSFIISPPGPDEIVYDVKKVKDVESANVIAFLLDSTLPPGEDSINIFLIS
jgi:hypothetical protein